MIDPTRPVTPVRIDPVSADDVQPETSSGKTLRVTNAHDDDATRCKDIKRKNEQE